MTIVFVLIAYLIGSVSSAIIVCKLMGLPDPRSTGSNNPGTTNVLRIGNKKAAVLTLVGDVLKGVIPVVLAKILVGEAAIVAACGMAAFLGHLYPVFFGFKGGKGVATAAGIFCGLNMLMAVGIIITWLVVALVSRYSSLAAILSAFAAPIFTFYMHPGQYYLALSVGISAFLVWRHRANISRLLAGEEGKINLKKK